MMREFDILWSKSIYLHDMIFSKTRIKSVPRFGPGGPIGGPRFIGTETK